MQKARGHRWQEFRHQQAFCVGLFAQGERWDCLSLDAKSHHALDLKVARHAWHDHAKATPVAERDDAVSATLHVVQGDPC